MNALFQSLRLGDIDISNRIVMAPLTRSRAGVERLPNSIMAKYYAQRATAGMIITEATSVDPMGVGYADTPGIWSAEQVAGWRKITQAVHAAGGKIVMQLWHVGRISDPMFLDGKTPLAPSAIRPKGHVSLVRPLKEFVTPRALATSEIPKIIAQFKRGAENAKLAEFDGVEIHGANGYLLDQFLQDGPNRRDDQYGGSLENRARLGLEVTEAVISVWGAGRVGYHIAPRGDVSSMGDSNPEKTFTYLAKELARRKIGFICARHHLGADYLGDKIQSAFGGNYIINERFEAKTAEEMIATGRASAVAFGMDYISNPDLVAKIREGRPLTPVNQATIYAKGEVGYTDYV